MELELRETFLQIPVDTTNKGGEDEWLTMAFQLFRKSFASQYTLNCLALTESLKNNFLFYPQPVAVGSAVLQLCKVIQSELLTVSDEIPVEKEGDQIQVGPLKVWVLLHTV